MEKPLAARASRVSTAERNQPKSSHRSKYKLFTEKERFPLKRRSTGDIIVPRIQLKHKTRHIESAIAVNGTSRAMQGSDCMRLRARVAEAGVRTENPKPLTPAYALSHNIASTSKPGRYHGRSTEQGCHRLRGQE